jgi:hypothetical protein
VYSAELGPTVAGEGVGREGVIGKRVPEADMDDDRRKGRVPLPGSLVSTPVSETAGPPAAVGDRREDAEEGACNLDTDFGFRKTVGAVTAESMLASLPERVRTIPVYASSSERGLLGVEGMPRLLALSVDIESGGLLGVGVRLLSPSRGLRFSDLVGGGGT